MFVSPQITSTVRDRLINIGIDTRNQAQQRLWWREAAYEEFTDSETQIFTFAIQSARLEDEGVSGQSVSYDSRAYLKHSVTNRYLRKGFNMTDGELTDLDSNKIQAAADWVRDITNDGIYSPQRLLVDAMIRNKPTYDGLGIFHNAHYVNGRNTVAGTYSNVITGVDISDPAVTLDVAVRNYAKAISTITGTLKDPSGKPRNLMIRAALAPSLLYPRLVQILQGQFAPGGAAGGGGGTQDITPIAQNLGLGKPVLAPELGSAFGAVAGAGLPAVPGSDSVYYIVCEFAGAHAPFVLSNRDPFRMFENSMGNDAMMAQLNTWEWIYSGRVAMMNMHPYLIFKCGA
jgi:hypothetical protein